MEILSTSEKDTEKVAAYLADKLQGNAVIALYGNLGAGKTTFTRLLVKLLGFSSRVQSPTFVLHRRYANTNSEHAKGGIVQVNHLDLYRLQNLNEVLELGFSEMLQQSGTLTIIEWPEIVEELLPKGTISIFFKEGASLNERIINVQGLD